MTRANKRLSGCLAALVIFLSLVTGVHAAVGVGDHPNIDFNATDGTRITSEALRGRLVIVDFWATWCGPCVKSMPHMIELNNQYAAQGVQVLGISLDSNRRSMENFVKQKKMAWPQYFDGLGWKNKMAKAWGVNSIPRIFIISPEGEVLWTGNPARMDKPFQDALQNHPPRLPADDDGPSMIELRDQAVAALRKARSLLDKADAEQVLALIAEVPEDVLTDKRVLANARVLLAMIEMKPEVVEGLEAAKESNPEIAERFAALSEAVKNTAAIVADDPSHAAVHPKLVASKLTQAQRSAEAGQHYRAYTLYNWLLDRVPETEAGHTAAQRIAELEADEEKMVVIRAAEAESQAKALLSLAKNYEAAGNPVEARATYERILTEYKAAAECCGQAEEALAKLEE